MNGADTKVWYCSESRLGDGGGARRKVQEGTEELQPRTRTRVSAAP